MNVLVNYIFFVMLVCIFHIKIVTFVYKQGTLFCIYFIYITCSFTYVLFLNSQGILTYRYLSRWFCLASYVAHEICMYQVMFFNLISLISYPLFQPYHFLLYSLNNFMTQSYMFKQFVKKTGCERQHICINVSWKYILQYNCLPFNYSYISLPNYIFNLPY